MLMAKNISAPLARTSRLLDLVPFLNTHQGISLKELAEQFDVTTAQMSSDLTTLWMCGLPGYTPLELMDLEFESGFVTIRNAPTLSKPRSISFDEGVALLLGLDLLTASVEQNRQDLILAVENLKQKISKVLDIPVTISASPKSSPAIAALINEALSKKSYLSVQYHSLYRDEITDRVIQPLELIDDNDNQYLRAFCFTAGAMRDFRVDRVLAAQISAEKPNTVVSGAATEKLQFTIAFKKPSRDVIERFGINHTESSKELQLRAFSQQWIERSVSASGESVELLEPLNIRANIARKAQLILDRYQAN
jgi:proteasome accessory factor C